MGTRRNGWRVSQHERHAESKAWGRQVERTGPAGNGGLGLDAAATGCGGAAMSACHPKKGKHEENSSRGFVCIALQRTHFRRICQRYDD